MDAELESRYYVSTLLRQTVRAHVGSPKSGSANPKPPFYVAERRG